MPAKNKSFHEIITGSVKYTILGTNIIAVLLLLLSIAAWYITPSKALVIAYLGMAFPILVVINFMYVILWAIFLKWKFVLFQVIVLILCIKPISTYFPLSSETKIVPENSFKILSYNVRAFNWMRGEDARTNPMFDYIKSYNADIICFQEFVVNKNDKDTKGIITKPELRTILKEYPYYSITPIRDPSFPYFIYGLACFSKYPIIKTEQLPIHSRFNGSTMYHLDIDGKKVTLINNHLESNRITAEDKQLYKDFFKSKSTENLDEVANNIQQRLGTAFAKREKQADFISDVIKKEKENSEAIIVCGDFNDTPISYTYNTIKGDLKDAYANTGFGVGITYHENKFWFRIDFILHSNNIESYNCKVGNLKYSDHYPISSYLKFKE